MGFLCCGEKPANGYRCDGSAQIFDGEVTSWVYVFAGYEGGLPTAWYLSEIAAAARKAGAPDDYVEALRARPTRTATTD